MLRALQRCAAPLTLVDPACLPDIGVAHACNPDTCTMVYDPHRNVTVCRDTQIPHVCMPLKHCDFVFPTRDGTHVCHLTGCMVDLGYTDTPVYVLPGTSNRTQTTLLSFAEVQGLNVERTPREDAKTKASELCQRAYDASVRALQYHANLKRKMIAPAVTDEDVQVVYDVFPRIVALRMAHKLQSCDGREEDITQDTPEAFRVFAVAYLYEAVSGRAPSIPFVSALSRVLTWILPEDAKIRELPANLGMNVTLITKARTEIAAMNDRANLLPGCTRKYVLP